VYAQCVQLGMPRSRSIALEGRLMDCLHGLPLHCQVDIKGLKKVHNNNDKYCRRLFEILGCFSFFSKLRIVPLCLQRPSKFFLPAQNSAEIVTSFEKTRFSKMSSKPSE
jgi:hypothetical protein